MEKKLTDSGAKAYQRNDSEWRLKPYSDWHRTLAKELLMVDVDFIEWRYRHGQLTPVGVMEVTRVDTGKHVGPEYLHAILARYEQRDMQAEATRKVAAALRTKAYIVLFRADCKEFWVYNLTERKGWLHLQDAEMENFLKNLG